jgi:hypothetical protein
MAVGKLFSDDPFAGCEEGTKIAPHPMVKEKALSPFSVQETCYFYQFTGRGQVH